ncbi:MAG: aspartate aminotransferase family protein [Asticcacaulis sp.]
MSGHLLGVYNRAPIEVERGEGVRLHAKDGRVFLDLVQGIATNGLGHAHPKLVEALKAQAEKLWHVSNIFRIPDQEVLADRLCETSFADAVFFTNSGTEAIECALKMARKYHSAKGAPERIDVITFEGAFHGRTYAAVNAGGNPTYTDGFGPKLPGYVYLPFGDHEALKAAAAAPTTAAILVEPVQGEGGARAIPEGCLRGLRELCDQHGILLIFDEVQCGMGRTGKLWAYEWAGAAPDILATAKALGGGFPVGACLASAEAASGMGVGAHGSTFGGNPLAMAVALAAFNEITKPETLAHVTEVGQYLAQQLHGLKERLPDQVVDIRGKGFLIGVKLVANNREVMALARDHGLLVAGGGDNCIRLLPALILTQEDAREAVDRLEQTLLAVRAKTQAAVEAGA